MPKRIQRKRCQQAEKLLAEVLHGPPKNANEREVGYWMTSIKRSIKAHRAKYGKADDAPAADDPEALLDLARGQLQWALAHLEPLTKDHGEGFLRGVCAMRELVNRIEGHTDAEPT